MNAMNTISKNKISRLKIFRLFSTSKIFSKISQKWPIFECENRIFTNFINCKGPRNGLFCVVIVMLAQKLNSVVLGNCDFSQSQLYKFTIIFYNSGYHRSKIQVGQSNPKIFERSFHWQLDDFSFWLFLNFLT